MIKDIAVIGGGPSGLVALQVLKQHGFANLKCFERESMRGGLWNYYANPIPSRIPSSDPHCEVLDWTSPMYHDLEANVDKNTMAFGTKGVDPSLPLYMDRREVLGYIRQFGKQVDEYIAYSHRVTSVFKPDAQDKWTVRYYDGGEEKSEQFDAVVFGTGNFNLPNLPDRPGLKEWVCKYPGSVIHSKEYRKAEEFCGKNVLIVGGSTSAYDIARQVERQCNQLYQSIRSRSVSQLLGIQSINYLPDIDRFIPETRTVVDVDGNRVDGIDAVIFATGYLRSYPALQQINNGPHPIITDGLRMHNVYQHVFYTYDPTLVFLATPANIVPFPTAETQAIWVALVWKGLAKLPSVEKQLEWEEQRVQQVGPGARFHQQRYPENCDYHDFVTGQVHTVEGKNRSMEPRPCDIATRRIRAHMVPLKVGHEKFKQKLGRKAYSIDEMICEGCFEWTITV